ncbi:DUF7504 family protein [Halorussus ruber]|uniref:DUF7504 family protein n=1 Tax=Halorussus ruber TaxID=1126238 RepID=UPI00109205ED|nr:hypothetical protein [Halorussus ruber]
MQNTKLIRTCVDGDPHTLVLRRRPTDVSTLDLLFDAVAPERPTDALAVTDDGTEGFLEAWTSQTGRRPRNIGMISVGERMRSAASSRSGSGRSAGGSSPASPSGPGESAGRSGSAGSSDSPGRSGQAAPPVAHNDIVQGVADPTDTDAICDAVLGYLDAWPTEGRTVVYFDAVSSLLDELGTEETADLLGELVRELDARDAVGYVCLTPEDHNPAVVREVASLFDTVVECTGSAADAVAEPSVSDCFDALADARRRYVLGAVLEGGTFSVDALADGIADRSSADREEAYVSLLNVHLPKLADLALISYDRDAETVSPGYHFGRTEPYLRHAMEIEGEEYA